MVFQKGKFGVRTGRTMKGQFGHCTGRSRGQFTVTKQAGNSQDGGFRVHQVASKSTTELNNQFEGYDGCLQSGGRVVYSLNKHKRWMLPSLLKQHIDTEYGEPSEDRDQAEVVMVERHLHPVTAGRKADCTGICRSALPPSANRIASRKQRYSCSRDLLRSAKPTQSGSMELLTVYDVSYMPPCDSYPHFHENSPLKPKKHEIYSLKKYPKFWSLKNDVKVFEGQSATGVVDDKSNVTTPFYNEQQEEPNESRLTRRNSCFTLGDFCLSQQRPCHYRKKSKARKKHPTDNLLPQRTVKYSDTSGSSTHHAEELSTDTAESTISCKSSVVDSSREMFQRDVDVSAIKLLVSAETVRFDHLFTKYDNRFNYAACTPRKFTVDVTAITCQNLVNRGYQMHADQLSQTGHSISVLFESAALREDRTDCTPDASPFSPLVVNEAYRVKLVGLSSPHPEVGAHFNKDRIYDVEEVVSLMTSSLTTMPPNKIVTVDNNCWQKRSNNQCSLGDLSFLRHLCGWNLKTQQNPCQALQQRDAAKAKVFYEEQPRRTQAAESEFCDICFQDLSGNNGLLATCLNECSHWFCNECWTVHILTRIYRKDTTIKCPGYKCESAVDRVTLAALVPTASYDLYLQNLWESQLVRDSWRFCPTPTCGRLVKMECAGSRELDRAAIASCQCGSDWCYSCLQEPHWPASCQQAKEHRKALQDKMQSLSNSKPKIEYVYVKTCPACKAKIEKNEGCPHMSCICGAGFCWNCLGLWSEHNYEGIRLICPQSSIGQEKVFLESEKRLDKENMHKLSLKYYLERSKNYKMKNKWPTV